MLKPSFNRAPNILAATVNGSKWNYLEFIWIPFTLNLDPRIKALTCKLNPFGYPVNTIACNKVQFFHYFLRPKVPEGSKFVDDFLDEEKNVLG